MFVVVVVVLEWMEGLLEIDDAASVVLRLDVGFTGR